MWSEATSGAEGAYARQISQHGDAASPLKKNLIVDDKQQYMANNLDLVEQIADEKARAKRKAKMKRRCYQGIIFLLCFLLNLFNRVREQLFYIWKDCQWSNRDATHLSHLCQDFKYSVMISSGIGFIFLGNIYDNIEKPRQLTALLLVIISAITLIEAIFSNDFEKGDQGSVSVSFTLFQMSALFEAGITLVCIVILHNWFREGTLGTVTAIWSSSFYLQSILQQTIYNVVEGDDSKVV